MELQINDLVSAIKKDGLEAAQKEADGILASAKKKADEIIKDALAEASRIKEASEKEIKLFEDNAKISAEQAKRDAVLSFKAEMQAEYEKLLASDIKKSLDDKFLAKLILAAAEGEDLSKYTVEVKEVGEALKSELAEEIKKGLEIKPAKNINAGFKLAAKDGSGYFDCSDEEITSMLMPFFREITL